MPGLGISLSVLATRRRATFTPAVGVGLRLNANCVTGGTDEDVISVQALGELEAVLAVGGSGVPVQKLSDGFLFSAGKYLTWQSSEIDWHGALVVADVTLLGDPTQTGFILKLSATLSGRFYLRYLSGAQLSGLGPDNSGGDFDFVKGYGERQAVAFLTEPAMGGISAGSQFRIMNADGIEVSGDSSSPMMPFDLSDVMIGTNANMVLHDLTIYPLSPGKGLPASLETLWKQSVATPLRDYSLTGIDVLPVNGQSLALGPATTQNEKNQNNFADRLGVKMLTGLERADGAAVSLIGPGSIGYNMTVNAAGIVPSKITNNLMVGHPIAVALNRMRLAGSTPILTGFAGYSGERIDNMDGDPLTGSGTVVIHENNEYWLAQAVAATIAEGRQASCRYTLMIQGQGDKNRAAGVWRAGVESFLSDHLAQIQINIPAASPKLVFSQANGDIDTTGEAWHVKAEQLQYATDTGALLVPLYAYETEGEGAVHPGAAATLEFSEVFAWAMHSDEIGLGWNIAKATSTLIGTDLELVFPLRQGESLVAHDPSKYGGEGISDLGFEVDGALITSVTLSGNTVVLHCDAAPTAWRYAMQSQDLTGAVMPYPAHRGLLRTDITLIGPLSGEILFRWIPGMETTAV